MKAHKLILSILLLLTATIVKGQIQEYVIEASDSLITRGVLQIDGDKFKATTQVSSDDTTLVSLDYLTGLLDASEYADSLAFHSNTGYLVYYRQGVALDSTSMDGRYQQVLSGTPNYIAKWSSTGLSIGDAPIYDIGGIVTGTRENYKLGTNTYIYNTSNTSVWRNTVTDALNVFSGGNTTSNGANIILYGGSHATLPSVFNLRQGSTSKLYLNVSGNWGFNTTTPTQLLDVNGNARFRNIGTTATTTPLGVTSDGTLTTNVSNTGGVTWMGSWNANTNTPTLSDATGNDGEWYKVGVAGTQNLGSGSVTYAVGDDVIHNGSIWEKFSTSVSEVDPVFTGSDVRHWTTADSTNWAEAYNWGDHATAGYLTTEVDGDTENELQNLSLGTVTTTTQPINISSGTGVTLPAATTTTAGLMTAADKTKLESTTSGSGTINYFTKWSNTTGGISDAPMYDDNSSVITGTRENYKFGTNTYIYNAANISIWRNTVSDGTLQLAGGNGTADGGNITLYGSTNTSEHKIQFRSGNTVRYYMYPTTHNLIGSVGINTATTPTATLDVSGNARFRTIGTGTLSSLLGVTSDGTLTTNVPTYLTAEVDGSVNNEGSLTVTAGTATTSVINSNTSGSTPVTLTVDGTNLGISESGNTITLSNLKPDQTVSLTGSGATSVSGTYPNFTISSTDNNTTYTGSAGVQLVGNDFRMNIGSLTAGAISASTHYIPWYQTTGAHWRTSLAELQAVAGYNAGKIQNVTVSSTSPTTDYVLKYNGTTWAPAPDATGAGALTSGDAINVTGDSINYKPTRITATMTDLNMLNNAASIVTNFEYGGALYRTTLGQLTDLGLYNARELRGYTIASATPSTGEVLKWTGTQWEPEPDATGGMTDPMTTRGDIIYRNSSNVTARLGRGTAGQLLYSNGTDLSWRTPVKADIGLGSVENTALSTWTGSTNLSTVGSITQGNWNADPISAVKGGTGKTSYTAYALLAGGSTSTGTLQQISGVGTAGQVLTSNGAGALPSWQNASSGFSDPMTSVGDMIYRNTSNVTSRLARGTEGQILSISAFGVPSWVNNSSGGWVDAGSYVYAATTTDNVVIGGTTNYGHKLTVIGNSSVSGLGGFGSLSVSTSALFAETTIPGNPSSPVVYSYNVDGGLKSKLGNTGLNDIHNITPSVRANALNASSMKYYQGNYFTDTLTVNTIYYITHIPNGGGGEILVKQDGTGGRTLTLYFYDRGQTGEGDYNIELNKVTVGATTAIKTTANKHTLVRYQRFANKVTLEYLQEP